MTKNYIGKQVWIIKSNNILAGELTYIYENASKCKYEVDTYLHGISCVENIYNSFAKACEAALRQEEGHA